MTDISLIDAIFDLPTPKKVKEAVDEYITDLERRVAELTDSEKRQSFYAALVLRVKDEPQ